MSTTLQNYLVLRATSNRSSTTINGLERIWCLPPSVTEGHLLGTRSVVLTLYLAYILLIILNIKQLNICKFGICYFDNKSTSLNDWIEYLSVT